jgi:hypothetical protein
MLVIEAKPFPHPDSLLAQADSVELISLPDVFDDCVIHLVSFIEADLLPPVRRIIEVFRPRPVLGEIDGALKAA